MIFNDVFAILATIGHAHFESIHFGFTFVLRDGGSVESVLKEGCRVDLPGMFR
jgi:hypothetical protein